MTKKKQSCIALVLFCLILSACSTKSVNPYQKPSDQIVSDALAGGAWVSDIPAPNFIDKLDNRYLETADDTAILEFYQTPREDVETYVEALKKAGFKVEGIVEYFEGNEELAEEQLKDQHYDAYHATKQSYIVHINIEAYNKDVVQIQIAGLDEQQLDTLNIQPDVDVGELILTEEYFKISIDDEIMTNVQTTNPTAPSYWPSDIAVPAFIDSAIDHFSDLNSEVVMLEHIASEKFKGYLATLKYEGYEISKAVSYSFIENAQKNSSFYADNRNSIDRAKDELERGDYSLILAENELYTLKFDVMSASDEDKLNSDYPFMQVEIITK